MPHPLQVLLLLGIIVASAKLAGALANRLGQPAVFGELLAGLALGPTLLNLLSWPIFTEPSGAGATQSALLPLVRDLSQVGVVLLMLVAGLETDLAGLRRVGAVALSSALGGVVLPFAGGVAVAWACGVPLLWGGLFIGSILTATSVSISAQTMMELGVLRSTEGMVILGAAVIDDVVGILVLSVLVAFAAAGGVWDLTSTVVAVLRMAAYFTVAVLAGAAIGPLTRWAARLRVSHGLLAIVLAITFLYAWGAESLGGVASITGAYLAGVFFARTPYKAKIDAGLHPLTYSLFVPVFFVGIGLEADARQLGGRLAFTLLLVAVAMATKVAGCAGGARALGLPAGQSWRVGLGMMSRGEVGLIVAGYGLAHGIIGPEVFSASVVMVIATTMVTPPALRLAFSRRAQAPSGPTSGPGLTGR